MSNTYPEPNTVALSKISQRLKDIERRLHKVERRLDYREVIEHTAPASDWEYRVKILEKRFEYLLDKLHREK